MRDTLGSTGERSPVVLPRTLQRSGTRREKPVSRVKVLGPTPVVRPVWGPCLRVGVPEEEVSSPGLLLRPPGLRRVDPRSSRPDRKGSTHTHPCSLGRVLSWSVEGCVPSNPDVTDIRRPVRRSPGFPSENV